MTQIRIGIDVGGTFTHAVAIDNQSLEILGYAVTPTTHRAEEGVARGVVQVFLKLLEELKEKGAQSESIIFVAHSTTQATNALLEGDVSAVAILAVGSGVEGMKAKMDAEVPDIEIAPGKMLRTHFAYLDTSKGWEEQLEGTIQKLIREGGQSLVAAEAFSVDDPAREMKIKEISAGLGLPACGTFEMSGLYGLRTRTRTAVINASILPKMMDTAELTGKSLSKAQVTAPLMIMRSDGGVMSLEEMKRRPLLTLLSGPAAGIAAALTYIRATDAIFLEVGGTSTDISVIRNGKAIIRSAQIGGHQTYMKTLDSRTLGVAGGSLIRVEKGKIAEVGPRSAHIAGLPYISFTEREKLEGALKITTIQPRSGDPPYLAVENEKGERFALTTTCAANFLHYIREGDYAKGIDESVKCAFEALAAHFGRDADTIAREIMEKAAEKIAPTIQALIKDYELAEKNIRLIGGGGGCYAIVPYLAERMKSDHEIARHAEVISAIGAAMAMIRETLEKNIFNPKPEDLENMKREAEKSVVAMGADPDSVEVHIEVDGQKNIVRAIATGAIEFKSQDLKSAAIDDAERLAIIGQSFNVAKESIDLKDQTDSLFIYEVKKEEKRLWNLLKTIKKTLVVMDGTGTMRLQVPRGMLMPCAREDAGAQLSRILEKHRVYGDAGSTVPSVFLVFGKRVMDLSSVVEEAQVLSLAQSELQKVAKGDKVVVIIKPQD
jgi:N-methylhydantoinase A